MGDEDNYSTHTDELPDRGLFREVAVIIEIGSYEIKILDVRQNPQQWKNIPPLLIKKRKKFGNEAKRYGISKNVIPVRPFKDDEIKDMALFLDLLSLIFKKSLYEKAVVICENIPDSGSQPVVKHRNARKSLATELCGKFQLDAIYFAPQPLFSMMQLRNQFLDRKQLTGVVVDVGYSKTRVCVVYRGSTITACTVKSPIAGFLFNELLFKQLLLRYNALKQNGKYDMNRIKKDYCFVLQKDTEITEFTDENLELDENKAYLKKVEREVTILSDKFVLDKERFLVPEVLFRPNILPSGYSESDSLSHLIRTCKERYETYLARQLERHNFDFQHEDAGRVFKNIYLVGGSVGMEGMAERLRSEIEEVLVFKETEKRQIDHDANYAEVLEELNINFHVLPNRNERGMSAANGALNFSRRAENRKWLYATQVLAKPDVVVEKCPK